MNVIDLFSGIGGFSLGLERAGMHTVAFCEIDPYCRTVLARHWPSVPCYSDVRELTAARLAADGVPTPRFICGGFPCQDASVAQVIWGKREGAAGRRTGLYAEAVRLADELRPEGVLLENVPGLLSAGFGSVLGALAEIGFDAQWHCIRAATAGLPHRRDRLWILAYPRGSRLAGPIEGPSLLERAEAALALNDNEAARAWRALDADLGSLRSRDGVSVAMERRRIGPLGNAVVPQIPESIGRAVMTYLSTNHLP